MTDLFGNPIDEPKAAPAITGVPKIAVPPAPEPKADPFNCRPYYVVRESPTVTWIIYE